MITALDAEHMIFADRLAVDHRHRRWGWPHNEEETDRAAQLHLLVRADPATVFLAGVRAPRRPFPLAQRQLACPAHRRFPSAGPPPTNRQHHSGPASISPHTPG